MYPNDSPDSPQSPILSLSVLTSIKEGLKYSRSDSPQSPILLVLRLTRILQLSTLIGVRFSSKSHTLLSPQITQTQKEDNSSSPDSPSKSYTLLLLIQTN
jgi:hypothetical protein